MRVSFHFLVKPSRKAQESERLLPFVIIIFCVGEGVCEYVRSSSRQRVVLAQDAVVPRPVSTCNSVATCTIWLLCALSCCQVRHPVATCADTLLSTRRPVSTCAVSLFCRGPCPPLVSVVMTRISFQGPGWQFVDSGQPVPREVFG